ncbi:hypothetical protein Kpol_1041p28 [Vanderwaltozyma polyspora DSM 70294]|uniref:Malate dehydrogenase n=1 Tax=Vanderwaltozyma polyspora (strain ATCC 22028 / DSM 70294 / BCRC 21397 / CBS 2163 / NBRC 10782 / NRRL Y-8283 / UCD 57-17) TaxID=436907 RepID=A7TL95_VANPO|nr:uncharacterized protein Kpol_1041p28 [Vanderwaltozyma polyspora DSM 70294]EDO16970.1 hypothetical protein Kpol_1041p28 [Vanderwaltozyma polyspora DSM 70294]
MVKVCVLGASGGIGQPLSLLLKLNPYVSDLALYDISDITAGVAKDLSHINTNSDSEGYNKDEDFKNLLEGSELVIVTAGIPRKPGMTRDDLFKINAKIIQNLTVKYAKFAPVHCKLLIISNPVNSLIPVVIETLKINGRLNPSQVFGITMLDIIRSQTFLNDLLNDKKLRSGSITSKQFDKTLNLNNINVIGGHSAPTMVPILTNKNLIHQQDEIDALYKKIKFGGDEIVKAKNGKGSATLSMAYAGYFFANEILKKINCKGVNLNDCTPVNLPSFVYLPNLPNGKLLQALLNDYSGIHDLNLEYFSVPVVINPHTGNIKSLDISILQNRNALSESELKDIKAACVNLAKDIKTGEDFVKKNYKL